MSEIKYERITQPLFGVNSGATGITEFGSVKQTGEPVYTTDVKKIFNDAYAGGWSSAVVAENAPILQDMNSLFYALSYQLGYLFSYGIPQYDKATTYYKGAICSSYDNIKNKTTLYQSIVDNNKGRLPVDNPNYWEELKMGGGGGHTKSDIGSFHFSTRTDVPSGYLLTGNTEYDSATATNYQKFYEEFLLTGLIKAVDYDTYNQTITDNFPKVPTVFYTSNTSTNPTRTVDGSTHTGNEYALFNGATSFSINVFNYWVQEKLEKPYILASYQVQAPSTNLAYPTAWRIDGSSDGITWTEIDTQTGQTFQVGTSGGINGEIKTYNISYTYTSMPYQYYRITYTNATAATYAMGKIRFNYVDQSQECCGLWGIDTANKKFKTPCFPEGYFLSVGNIAENLGKYNQDQIVNFRGLFAITASEGNMAVEGSTFGGSNGAFVSTSPDNAFNAGIASGAPGKHKVPMLDPSLMVNTGERVQPRNVQAKLLVYIGGDTDYLENETMSRSEVNDLIDSKIIAALKKFRGGITLASCEISDDFAIPSKNTMLSWSHQLALTPSEISKAICTMELHCINDANGYKAGDTTSAIVNYANVNTQTRTFPAIAQIDTNYCFFYTNETSSGDATIGFFTKDGFTSGSRIVGVISGNTNWQIRFKLWYTKEDGTDLSSLN